jgi:protein-S-isoprenylcysteine O-methyltransferase Ste14
VVVLRHIVAILLLPTMVTVVVPRWILVAFAARDSRWPGDAWSWIPRTLGGLLVLAGLALVTWCISLFVRVGKGTLAPWDPTSNLVAVGPYCYTRNPMITGVATILGGEAVLFGSWRLALWALTFILFNHVYFLLVEEPGLDQRFGESYLEYKRAVPRWIPRGARRGSAPRSTIGPR